MDTNVMDTMNSAHGRRYDDDGSIMDTGTPVVNHYSIPPISGGVRSRS
jgi:hypothetical protein